MKKTITIFSILFAFAAAKSFGVSTEGEIPLITNNSPSNVTLQKTTQAEQLPAQNKSITTATTSTSIPITQPDVLIRIDGVGAKEKKNITLVLKKALLQTFAPTEEERIKIFYRNTTKYAYEALKPYGYFKPTITSQIYKQNQDWIIHFRINPGPRMNISFVQVQLIGEGNQDEAFHNLLTHLPVKIGEPLNVEHYQKAKNELYSLAAQRGYFDARFVKNQLIIDLPHYQAQIFLIFDTGRRYHFGLTRFSCTTLRLSFLQRYLNYSEGDYYDNLLIQQTQQDLASSNYFKQVLVTPEPEKAIGDQVPVKINMIPNNPRQYLMGIGFGTDTGVRGTFGVQLRQLNDRGHYFDALLRASQRDTSLTANYNIPGKRPAKDLYSLNASAGEIDQVTGKSQSYKFGPNYTTRRGAWNQAYGIYYLNEHYNLLNLPRRTASLFVPHYHLGHNHEKALISPKKGYNLNFDVAGGPSTQNVGTESFIQEKLQVKGLYTLNKNTRLLGRGEIGRTDIDNINNLPLSLQLFAGGAMSIRGYSYNSIGPGRNLLVLSGEAQQRVWKDLYFAGFYDVGNVGNKDYLADLRQGVGPGLVWVSPIGSFELTVARRIHDDDHGIRIQFAMGPDL